jgi:hypothetical protein
MAVSDLYFYPDDGGCITRLGPSLTLARMQDDVGRRINQSIAPGFVVHAVGNTQVSLAWQPNATSTTRAGPRSYDSWVLGISSTPFSWMPQATVSAVVGDAVDNVTGTIGDGTNFLATIPLRFSRLELASVIGRQTLRSRAADGSRKTLLSERNVQAVVTWHFSDRLSLRLTHERMALDASPPFGGLKLKVHDTSRQTSLLLEYQANWQTRYYFGALTTLQDSTGSGSGGRTQTAVFAKLSHAFSN